MELQHINVYSELFFHLQDYTKELVIMDQQIDGSVNQEDRSVSSVDGSSAGAAVASLGAPLGGEKSGDAPTATTTSGTKDGKKETKMRAKHKCPFASCSANIVHLPCHMMQVHKWAKKYTVGIVNAFCLRKPKKGSEKSKLKRKLCPLLNCKSVVKRLHNHLIDFHRMKRGSDVYRE